MRILSYLMLIGAAVVTHLRSGADAFTLGRHNSTLVIDIDDSSHETANFLDSAESNQTSIENDSIEVMDARLVVKRNPIGHHHQSTPIADQQPVELRVDRDYSWEDLIDDISELDRPQPPVGSQPTGVLAQFADDDDSLEDVIEDLAARRIILGTPHQTVGGIVAQQNVPAAVGPVAQLTNLGTLITDNRSSFGLLAVEDDDDFSLEDYADFVNPHAVLPTAAANHFHHLPDTLFSTHPTSDDWFLVKHFMDDHYVWELGDELAKEYFWQPVKAPGGV
ncbi:hypothetical protein DAPPUDRAFT_313921 [Daphnia pulex]|uniref:Uncharacterized protein n=1 Tax=Daphnia pulex TaxID=6669 RepID=E9G5P2_DAPPU|nr:hypothetical protein DAPPUDRAFT_313921 [Daphnia pulex]|eukprot:EFX85239.1 hypothetical protein DAPPUDRAFT_313921 [Daphnia pulex]